MYTAMVLTALCNMIYLALHVTGSSCFPQPLSKEEEQECLRRIEQGDEEAKNELIEHNLRLVAHIIKKYYASYRDQEDLISIGTIGLIKAASTFNSSKGTKFATYASRCIENEILMFLRKATQYRGEVSIDEPLNIDWDGNELLLSDILGTDADVVSRNIEQESERELLRSAVSELGTREREIMELRFGLVDGKEKTQKEVAQAIGISQSYISRLEKKIIRKLRGTLQQFNQ